MHILWQSARAGELETKQAIYKILIDLLEKLEEWH